MSEHICQRLPDPPDPVEPDSFRILGWPNDESDTLAWNGCEWVTLDDFDVFTEDEIWKIYDGLIERYSDWIIAVEWAGRLGENEFTEWDRILDNTRYLQIRDEEKRKNKKVARSTREKVKELSLKYTYLKLDEMTAWEIAGKITKEIKDLQSEEIKKRK